MTHTHGHGIREFLSFLGVILALMFLAIIWVAIDQVLPKPEKPLDRTQYVCKDAQADTRIDWWVDGELVARMECKK